FYLQAGIAVVLVLVYGIHNIEGTGGNNLVLICQVETNAVYYITIVLVHDEFEVLLLYHARITIIVIQIPGKEYRAHIIRAKWFELADDIVKGHLDII